MTAVNLILGHIINDDALAALTDFMADRCLDLEFAARFEPEVNLVEHRAGDPAPLCHPRDGGETHPGCMADDLKDVRNGLNAADYSNVSLNCRW